MADKGAELAWILNRRRQEVEERGAHFTKEDRQGGADASWSDRLDSQFSPRTSDKNASISRLPSSSSSENSPRASPTSASSVEKGRCLRAPEALRKQASASGHAVGTRMRRVPAALTPPKEQKEVELPGRVQRSFSAAAEPEGAGVNKTSTPDASPIRAAKVADMPTPSKSSKSLKALACPLVTSAPAAPERPAVSAAAALATQEQDALEGRPACVAPVSPSGSCCSVSSASTTSGCAPHAAPSLAGETGAGLSEGAGREAVWPALTLAIPGDRSICSAATSCASGELEEVQQTASSPSASSRKSSVSAGCFAQALQHRLDERGVITDSCRAQSSLWQAVMEGNMQQLEELAAMGVLSSGQQLDAKGHSVFWNAIAFQQPKVALFLLHQFPPGSCNGVDLAEVHAQTADTLLHLCLHISDFSEPAASLFRELFLGNVGHLDKLLLKALRSRYNEDLQTFFHIAAARLNFWVLRFALSSAPELTPLLWCWDVRGQSPLDVLLQKMSELGASPPIPLLQPVQEAGAPMEWMDFSKYVPVADARLDPDSAAAFADVEIEVEDADEPHGIHRVMAHRAILGASSGAMHQLLSELAPGRALKIDPLCCRSRKVLVSALAFVYCGRLSCDFAEDGFLLWQLLCLCARYGLPEPLRRYALSALLRRLIDVRYAAITPVLLQASKEVGLSPDEACFVACAMLRSPEAALGSAGSKEGQKRQAEAVLNALAEVERHALWSENS
eukprot:TRINITY_DN11230_c0_g1_i1.p1 TRINITY_DN11230_c0_g1~~TRINITY_DN11230_c0_g1_i1.p1  ORF type:complete len:751 (+),score=157.16 TRINITY_DN11230_c0_g1_i1:52-2253(+)